MAEKRINHKPLWSGIVIFAILGAWLRLWSWPNQVLLNDEWHSLNYVTDKRLADIILCPVGVGATSIPENIYTWLTLHTVGWSENVLRLPSMFAGLLALVVIPLLVNRLWGLTTALTTAALLSTSPVLIFYSRIARPYSITMLLGATSLLLTLIWTQTGRRRYLLLSAACGTLAVYYHSSSAIPVFVPFIVVLLAALTGKKAGISLASVTPLKDLALAAATVAVFSLAIVIPSLINTSWLSNTVVGDDHATLTTAYNVLGIVSGTHLQILRFTILVLAISGLIAIYRQSRITGIVIFFPILTYTVMIASISMITINEGIQVTRYGITFVPVIYAMAAFASAKLAELISLRLCSSWSSQAIVIVQLIVWSPFVINSHLREIYQTPNNFTNHCAYQNLYSPMQWKNMQQRDQILGYPKNYSQFPAFYSDPGKMQKIRGIIEYPMMVGDPYNVYYHYQHLHKKPVLGGYMTTGNFERIPTDNSYVLGNYTVDYVMEAIHQPLRKKNRWRTMVNLEDTSLLKLDFSGWLVVVHKNPAIELFPNSFPDYPVAAEVIQNMTENFGEPYIREKNAIAWILK